MFLQTRAMMSSAVKMLHPFLLLVDENEYDRLFHNEFFCENTVLILHLHVIGTGR